MDCTLRPPSTDKLLERLKKPDLDSREKEALQALSDSMVNVFYDDSRLKFMKEAAELASVATGAQYGRLLAAFANLIIKGTQDGTIPDPIHFKLLSRVIQHAPSTVSAESARIIPLLDSLSARLEKAMNAKPELEHQYQLVSTTTIVLDAMVDIKISGLSREKLHEPLLNQLKVLASHEDIRLAQAASYAYQGLVGIPNDESSLQALWRHAFQVGTGLAKLAGTVATMDPAKALDAIQDLQDIPALITAIVEAAKQLYDVSDSLTEIKQGLNTHRKQKAWYMALRFADTLVQSSRLDDLTNFVKSEPWANQKEFLCGMYARLEVAAMYSTARERLIEWMERVLVPLSTHPRVQAWARLVASSLNQLEWDKKLQKIPSSSRGYRQWRRKDYCSKLAPFTQQEDDGQGLLTGLLEAAWLTCEQAKLFYADAAVRDYYHQQKRLHVERLSGAQLPMDRCYINLAIVERLRRSVSTEYLDSNSRRQYSKFSLAARLKVETPPEASQVSLSDMFKPRKQQDGRMIQPKRILIRGRAGVGKTTMCKKMVYEFLNGEIWSESFDRILWVPLRNLKGKSEERYNLGKLFQTEYLFQHVEKKLLAEALEKAVTRTHVDRTLFILDGLDEVSQEWSLYSSMSDFLHELLQQPNIIITSRPHGTTMVALDQVHLELETIGFSVEQVKAYLKAVCNQNKELEIDSFIQSHILVQSLVRIPIQLDALCYGWDRKVFSQRDVTMTALYQAIELKLWEKDILRLGKEDKGMILTQHKVRSLQVSTSDIKRVVTSEGTLLEALAFNGMVNDIIEFHPDDRQLIYRLLNHEEFALGSDSNLSKISFLHSSDTASEEEYQSYHFIHLTFQEFFAASYFVRQWKSGQDLKWISIDSEKSRFNNTVQLMEPRGFLRKEKCNSRYNTWWRFVAGLLQEEQDDILLSFFQVLEDEPRDLIGPGHQRLIMHCLNEVSRSSEILRKELCKLETRLLQWMLFEYKHYRKMQLCAEMECPESLLRDLLSQESGIKKATMVALSRRARVSSENLDLISCELRNTSDVEMRRAAIRTVVANINSLTTKNLKAFIQLLEEGDKDVASVLRNQSSLPEPILQALMDLLQDKTKHTRADAAFALSSQSSLSEPILQALIPLLQDKSPYMRSRAANALQRQSFFSEPILQGVSALLQDKDPDIRSNAACALAGQSSLSGPILQTLTALLQDEDEALRFNAAHALGKQSSLSEPILHALVALLQDNDQEIQNIVSHDFANRPFLSESILQALASLLQDNDQYVRLNATTALLGQSYLPEPILQTVVGLLQDKQEDVRSFAADVLGFQSFLSEPTLQALGGLLQDESKYVRAEAAFALGSHSSLSEPILQALACLLLDKAKDVRFNAAIALGKQILSEPILQDLIFLLQHPELDKLAELVLRSQSRFYFMIPSLEAQYLTSLFKIWLQRSFEDSISCFLWDEKLVIDQGGQIRSIPVEKIQQEMLKSVILEAQNAVGVPSRTE